MSGSAPSGFTLLEMMIVVCVIAILATLAIPSYLSSAAKEQIVESLKLVEQLKLPVERFYLANGSLPENHLAAGIPGPDKLLGNYVKSIELKGGSFHIAFGNKAVKALQGKHLSVRALTVSGSAASPMSWLCGYSSIPVGMQASLENRTSIQPEGLLPVACRQIAK